MIANARMYSPTAAAAECWRGLFETLASRAGVTLEYFTHRAPAPIDELWERADLGAVFMCGLPYSRAARRPNVLAAPIPAPPEFGSAPVYWSHLVVRQDSRFRSVADTFGHRLALTVPGSQSGCAAALRYFAENSGPEPRFDALIHPTITPQGALQAVLNDTADVAPIDAYAFALLQRFEPTLTAGVRIVGRTATTPIPALVATEPPAPQLVNAFLTAHSDPRSRPFLDALQLERFVAAAATTYDGLSARYESDIAYWHRHALAGTIHPAFDGLTPRRR